MDTSKIRKGLGRGLSSLIGDAKIKTNINKLSITDLIRNKFQPRKNFNKDSLSELTNSIKEQGVIQPIIVRPSTSLDGKYEIIAGERRWLASQNAGLHEVPTVILNVDDVKSFDEAMYILLCGTGVGFSVERNYINKLPEIPERLFESHTTVVVSDSKEGWAKAFRQLVALLYAGEIPSYDTSKVRPAGARLKIFGGRASGPAPLIDLFKFTINMFKSAAGRKLTSYECQGGKELSFM